MVARTNFWLCDNLTDFPLIQELTKEAHRMSFFKGVPFDEDKVYSIVEKSISNRATNGIMLAGNTLGLKGAAFCSVGEYIIGSGVLLTTIHGIYVVNEARNSLLSGRVALGLLKGVETWSAARSSIGIWMHATSGIDNERADKLAHRSGYFPAGQTFFKKCR